MAEKTACVAKRCPGLNFNTGEGVAAVSPLERDLIDPARHYRAVSEEDFSAMVYALELLHRIAIRREFRAEVEAAAWLKKDGRRFL